MTNFGEDAHNLRVSGPAGYRSAVSRDVAPAGGHLRFTVHLLRAGTYRLVCLKPGHAAKGMKATLRVTRRHAALTRPTVCRISDLARLVLGSPNRS